MVFGGVDAIDVGETGFLGLGGQGSTAPDADTAASVISVTGTLDSLQAHATKASAGNVVVTVERATAAAPHTFVATPLTCTITGSNDACADGSDSVAFAAGDRIAVLVQNSTGGFVSFVRYTGTYR
jgi:hypothetical protein